MITGIDHVHVLTTDLDRSLDFWINALGFRLDRRVEFGPPERHEARVTLHGSPIKCRGRLRQARPSATT